jgi:hypothetical protein
VVFGGREARHHQVDALRVHDAVLGGEAPLLVDLVDERSGGVDDRACRGGELVAGVDVAESHRPLPAGAFGRHHLDVVGRGCTGVDGRPHEREHEPGVVVDEDAVVVLDAAERVRRVDRRFSRSMCSVDNTRGRRVPNIPMIQ